MYIYVYRIYIYNGYGNCFSIIVWIGSFVQEQGEKAQCRNRRGTIYNIYIHVFDLKILNDLYSAKGPWIEV